MWWVIPGRGTSSLPGGRILLYGDNFPSRQSCPRCPTESPFRLQAQLCQAPREHWIPFTSLQCQPCEKRPLYIWYKASTRLIHGARNIAGTSARSPFLPLAARFSHPETTHRGLCFPPGVILGERPEKSPILFSPPHLPKTLACRCLAEAWRGRAASAIQSG